LNSNAAKRGLSIAFARRLGLAALQQNFVHPPLEDGRLDRRKIPGAPFRAASDDCRQRTQGTQKSCILWDLCDLSRHL